jgi:hypothetical protein
VLWFVFVGVLVSMGGSGRQGHDPQMCPWSDQALLRIRTQPSVVAISASARKALPILNRRGGRQKKVELLS